MDRPLSHFPFSTNGIIYVKIKKIEYINYCEESTNTNSTQLPIIQHLNPAAAQAFCASLEEKNLPAGEILFHQGQASDSFYFVQSGELRVLLRHPDGLESCVAQPVAGDCVGEITLLSDQPHATTITTGTACELLSLSMHRFAQLIDDYPELIIEMTNQLLPLYKRIQAGAILTSLFGTIDDDILNDLIDKISWRRLRGGEELFHQGDQGDTLYIVVQGRLRFSVQEANGSSRILGEVGAGESIGEFALLAESGTAESRRSATVFAARQTDVVGISRTMFESLVCRYPQIVLNITRRIVQRQRLIDHSALAGSRALVICVIPTRSGLNNASNQSEFARQLAGVFNGLGCTLAYDPQQLEEWYGKTGAARIPLDHPNSLLLSAWLDERECKQQFIIYDTSSYAIEEGQLSPWAQRCSEDADIILLVAEDSEHAAAGEVEKCLVSSKTRAPIELVMLHPAGCQIPCGTADWLSPHRTGGAHFQAHHHIRLGNPVDFRRLVRRITGRSVGLTLSGGGARGWAHIGVIRALEEAGIEIDLVGGASMGAVLAAAYALGWNSIQLSDLAARFADPKKLLDFTFPYASLTATKRITNVLQQVCDQADIQDTWRPFFCVSSNLTKGEEQLHINGKLWEAIRASMAFPAIFAPFLDAEGVLIDGGAANNVPVDRMRELLPKGKVIGINLATGSPLNKTYRFGPFLSGWQALISRFTPFAKQIKAPNLFDIVAGIVYSNNLYRFNETRDCADLIIDVPVEEFGLLDFDKYNEIVELGYRVAKEQLNGFKI